MQTIWNRVATTKCGCRCPQCLSSARAVTRRAATSAPRHIPRFFTTSTFAYTSIFAVAATYDAGNKQERREQWDRAIERVKQQLGRDEWSTETAAAQEKVSTRTEVGKAADRSSTYRPFGPENDGEAEDDVDAFRHVDPQNPQAQWPTNAGPPLRPGHLPPQSIYLLGNDRREQWRGHIWSAKKLAVSTLAMERLNLAIFKHLQEQGWSPEAATAVPESHAEHFLQSSQRLQYALKRLRGMATIIAKSPTDEGIPFDISERLCHFEQDSEGRFKEGSRQLTAALVHHFRLHSSGVLSTPALLAKISHVICASRAAPDVNSYNALLLGLSRAGQTALTEEVIRAARRSNLRPNEVTLAAILRHYTRMGDSENFARWIGLLRGENGGLMLARQGTDVDIAACRLRPHPNHPSKIIQLPYAEPMVFAELVAGVLKFAGFEAAMTVCDSLGTEGWGLCQSGMGMLLRDCADRGDWARGSKVWENILALQRKSRKESRGNFFSERIRLPNFAAMLRLCSACRQGKVYGEVFEQARLAHGQNIELLVRAVRRQEYDVRLRQQGRVNGTEKPLSMDTHAHQNDDRSRGEEIRNSTTDHSPAETEGDGTRPLPQALSHSSHRMSQEPGREEDEEDLLPFEAVNMINGFGEQRGRVGEAPTSTEPAQLDRMGAPGL